MERVLRGVRTGWRGFRADLDEVLPAGDRALALGSYKVIDASDAEVVAPFTHIHTINARLIRAFDQYTDTAVLAAARERA